MRKGVCVALVGCVLIGGGVASMPALADADEDIRYRKLQMSTMGGSLRSIMAIAQGKLDKSDDFAALVNQAAAATALHESAFSANTDGQGSEETTAKGSIWENWEDFSGRLTKLNAGMQAAAGVVNEGGSAEDVVAVLKDQVFVNCKSCHDDYRTK